MAATVNDKQVWHKGTATELTPGMSVTDQLNAAGLNWTVELAPNYYEVDGMRYEVPGKQVAYRSDTKQYIDHYERRIAWQNRDVVEAFNSFCDIAELPLGHIGRLPSGLYCAAKMPQTIEPQPGGRKVGDLSDVYLLLTESHKAGNALTVSVYANRLVCTNGMTRRVKLSNRTLAHLGDFDTSKVHATLDAACRVIEQQSETATKLTEVALTDAEALAHLIKLDGGDASQPLEKQSNLVQTVYKLYKGQAKGSEMLHCFNTAYGLMQGLTEYQSHWSRARGGPAGVMSSLFTGTRAAAAEKLEKQLVSVHLG